MNAFAVADPEKNVNGMSVIARQGDVIFMRLPQGLWRSCGKCNCSVCRGREGFWDTLAVTTKPRKGENDTTWTVHMPK